MPTKERKRKCFKCGCSPELTTNVKLLRFPKPGTRNNLKCALWAKYMFPEDQQHCSSDFQMKLYTEHRMLCNQHFRAEAFADNSKTKLKRTANPQDDENEPHLEEESQNVCVWNAFISSQWSHRYPTPEKKTILYWIQLLLSRI